MTLAVKVALNPNTTNQPSSSSPFFLWLCFFPSYLPPPNASVSFSLSSLAEPHSSVGSVADLRTGGRWFHPRLGQYSFRGLIIVTATGFIPLSPLSVVSTTTGKQQVACKEYCAEYWLKELQESMDKCNGHRDMTEIRLKKALNTIQSIVIFIVVVPLVIHLLNCFQVL